jgi:translation elongation factor EF-1alpha
LRMKQVARWRDWQAGWWDWCRLGFKESAVQWVPVSGQQAENLWEAPTAAALAEWWPGPTLVGAVDKLTPPARLNALPLRLPVAEVVTHSLNRTLGAVAVGGKLEAGVLKAGTQVLIMPANTLAVVKVRRWLVRAWIDAGCV